MKTVCVIIAVAIFFISCTSSSKLSESNQLLKEYAYCKCFQFASGDTAYFINDVSLSVYSDLASYNSTAYEKIDSLTSVAVRAFGPSEIADYKNKKAVFLCSAATTASIRCGIVPKSLRKFAAAKGAHYCDRRSHYCDRHCDY